MSITDMECTHIENRLPWNMNFLIKYEDLRRIETKFLHNFFMTLLVKSPCNLVTPFLLLINSNGHFSNTGLRKIPVVS